MEIKYYKKNVWGNVLIYINGKQHNIAISELTNQRTVTERQLRALEKLGFTMIEILESEANYTT